MSLAMYAAPFNEDLYQVATDDIEKKRISSKNKTDSYLILSFTHVVSAFFL